MKVTLPLALAALATTPLLASPQNDPCEGNALGDAFLEVSPFRIGGTLDIDMGSPSAPFGLYVISVTSSFGPILHPIFGEICFDTFAPGYFILTFVTDAAGNASQSFPVANDISLATKPPVFVDGLAVEPLLLPDFSITKTVRLQWSVVDGFHPAGTMGLPRALHTATSLAEGPADNRTKVLVAGGGGGFLLTPESSATTEVFDPLTRTFEPGPDMGQERAAHTAVRLKDGRVLICGGADSGGVVTATCELYDPDTNTFSAAASMASPRTGHAMTLLPDGRVFVTGGLSNYVDATTDFVAVLNSVQATTEIYNPLTDTWSAGPLMSSPRGGHRQTVMQDGKVFIVGGINGAIFGSLGGEFPQFTSSCQLFDPVTNTLTIEPPLPIGRAFHGQSLVGSDGDLLISGGIVAGGPFGEALATNTCLLYDGINWAGTGSLPITTGFHAQVQLDGGDAVMQGGLVGDLTQLVATSLAGRHDGITFTPGNEVGQNPAFPGNPAAPRGNQTMTRLYDGSFLVLGGSSSEDAFTPTTFADGFLYVD